MSHPKVILYAGLPGAGKTSAAEIGHRLVGGTLASMGDALREAYYEETNGPEDSQSIGEYATRLREESGPAAIVKWMVSRWRAEEDRGRVMSYPVHIDGVRSPEEVEVFEDHFGNVSVVYLSAGFEVRLPRLNDRGRDGEDAFSHNDLFERDTRELSWGVGDLLLLDQTYRMDNGHTARTLENRLRTYFFNIHDFSPRE